MRQWAICGGTPAFSETLHVGRPNIGSRETLFRRLGEMLDRGWLSNRGPLVLEFERALQSYLGVKHCIAMCNGTIALEIATRALGLEGEVIVPSMTFIATAHALYWQGIRPVFADIDPVTFCLDPADVDRRITPATTGIIGVHLYGRGCDTEGLQDVADRHGLKLMFDAAHAFGCSHGGQRIGHFGQCEVLSFHATKFFNTFEGGAVATNDDDLAERIRLMQNFGFAGLDNVIYPGTNGKMVEACAAMGLTNLESLDELLAINRRNYDLYQKGFESIPGIELADLMAGEDYNYQYVVVRVQDEYPLSRDELMRVLHAENVRVRRYFWPGCHRMEPYRTLYPASELDLPVTEKAAEQILAFPTGQAVSPEAIAVILDMVRTLAESKLAIPIRDIVASAKASRPARASHFYPSDTSASR